MSVARDVRGLEVSCLGTQMKRGNYNNRALGMEVTTIKHNMVNQS